MTKMKKKWLYRALCAALAVTLTAGTAVMTPIADIVGTNITAHASENIIAQGSYWKVTDEDFDGNYKLTFFGTIPTHEAINAEAREIYYASASAGAASPAELIKASWVFATNYVTEVTTEEGAKTSADASSLFENFSKVTSMDLSNLDTSNATNMYCMFYNCSSLTSLNLSGWDTSNVENMKLMFGCCPNLKTIIVGNGWNTGKVTNSDRMFDSCTSLVGGNGTTYTGNNPKDKTYARIDGSANAPGYFTKGYYTVTWKDGETTLRETDVITGQSPVYDGTTPTKDGYVFAGWTDGTNTYGVNPTDINVITGSITLTFEEQASDVIVKVRVS